MVSTLAEPILGHRAYVADVDPSTGAISLRSNTPGPAGSLVVEFDGVTLGLDAADPSLVNFIDAHDGRASLAGAPQPEPSLLRRLIGDAAVDSLRNLAPGHSDRPHRIESADGGREQTVPSRIARLAAALAGTEGPGLLPQEAALAMLEAYAIARHAGLANDLPASEERLERAASVVAGLSEVQIVQLTRLGRGDAADVCDVVSEWTPEHLADALRDVAARIRDDSAGLGRVASATAPPRAAVAVDVRVSPASLPALIAEIVPSVSRSTNDELEVRLHGWAERANGWWVRAIRTGGQVPLAVVPMRSIGSDAVAELLLPPADGATFELDIVDDPGSARPSEQLAAFRAAIAAGQRAARLERLDRRDAAAHAWQRSSELYAQAGDDVRARQAEAIMSRQRNWSHRFAAPHVAPTLADHFLPS